MIQHECKEIVSIFQTVANKIEKVVRKITKLDAFLTMLKKGKESWKTSDDREQNASLACKENNKGKKPRKK